MNINSTCQDPCVDNSDCTVGGETCRLASGYSGMNQLMPYCADWSGQPCGTTCTGAAQFCDGMDTCQTGPACNYGGDNGCNCNDMTLTCQ